VTGNLIIFISKSDEKKPKNSQFFFAFHLLIFFPQTGENNGLN
jgi:hypothetical protein